MKTQIYRSSLLLSSRCFLLSHRLPRAVAAVEVAAEVWPAAAVVAEARMHPSTLCRGTRLRHRRRVVLYWFPASQKEIDNSSLKQSRLLYGYASPVRFHAGSQS